VTFRPGDREPPLRVERLELGPFSEIVVPLLLRDEARNNLALGIVGTLREHPEAYTEPAKLWTVRSRGEPVAAALRTPPHHLVLTDPQTDATLDALTEALLRGDVRIPGVVGNLPAVDGFVTSWRATTGAVTTILTRQGVYALERVAELPAAPGAARRATRRDRDRLLPWLIAFAEEALPEPDPERMAAMLDQRLPGDSGTGILVWEVDGEPVSLAGFGGPTPNGIRVGPVYTPPEHRGRGSATGLVAELSRRLLAAGRRFCFLYTDLANPTSNAIYERIGYRRVCESADHAFTS
jgi:uncharacterized protein